MKRISVNTLTNQDISSALLCGTYTADGDKALYARVFADQIAGNGDYIIHATIQRSGAGSQHLLAPKSTVAVPAATTSVSFVTNLFPIKSGDVLRVYIQGLAGDTITPDIITEFWEDESSTLGAGAIAWPITINDGVNPLDGVDVWVSTDSAGNNVIARGITDDNGVVTFMLDLGTYYAWKQLAGYNFTNPQSFTVT